MSASELEADIRDELHLEALGYKQELKVREYAPACCAAQHECWRPRLARAAGVLSHASPAPPAERAGLLGLCRHHPGCHAAFGVGRRVPAWYAKRIPALLAHRSARALCEPAGRRAACSAHAVCVHAGFATTFSSDWAACCAGCCAACCTRARTAPRSPLRRSVRAARRLRSARGCRPCSCAQVTPCQAKKDARFFIQCLKATVSDYPPRLRALVR